MGMLEALFVLFVTLKLIGLITWSWWWVTAPLWGAAVVYVLAGLTYWRVMK